MLVKKSEFINAIQSLKTFENPKLHFEQYITDAVSTADLFFHIAFEQQDLSGNLIVDLGCGSGNLTVAAILLGAEHVISVDIDPDALKILRENLQNLDIEDRVDIWEKDLRTADINKEIRTFYTEKFQNLHPNSKIIVVSNPPFGVKQKGADLVFLQQAMAFSDVIYSIHLGNDKVRTFLSKKIERLGGVITNRLTLSLILKKTYKHQKKFQKPVMTDVYRIIPVKSKNE
ncbi:MAG: METTL5 family protein [Promethearchaeota archaeon]